MSGILTSLQGILGTVRSQFLTILDRIFPPEQRAEMLEKLKTFAINNPKLAAFLTAQIAFTGFPLLMFIAFSITVFLFALIAALLIGLIAALLFTVLMVAVALIVVLPTIFLTTFFATFVFLWGLGGFYLLKWFNEGAGAAPDGKAIGDKLNSLTGGRMGWLMDGTRKKVNDAKSGVDQTPTTHGSDANGNTKNGRTKNGDEKKENGSATSTGVSDAEKDVGEGKETVTKRPPKLNQAATNTAKSTAGNSNE
ncbi:hypothetical protein B0J11DRAFT_559822 [Dendryphion nanum]|uniref:Uncharacterized protein n=1 Tax=Dendryphion nanum TaxID=256645 RepID=A0A9P9DP78_9PLEO|nr:hypothetical protein B0J11DRAFT_559822 [Dendryphion nanum]